MKVNANDVVSTGNSYIPGNNYVLRVADETFKTSAGGNPMIEYDLEMIGVRQDDGSISEIIEVNGKKVNIGGKQTKFYLTLTPNNMERVFDWFRKWGRPIDGIDTDAPLADPQCSIKNLAGDFYCSTEESPLCKELTAEERAVGKKQGDPIKKDGKPVMFYRLKAGTFLGVTEVATGRSY